MRKLLMASVAMIALAACEPAEDMSAAHLVSGVNQEALDASVRPQDDFNAHVNGKWMAATEIPADKTSWGSFNILRDNADKHQRTIIEELSGNANWQAGTDEQRIGDMYASFMDQAHVDSLGASPVQAGLDEIFATQSTAEVLNVMARNHVYGVQAPLGMGIFPDLKNSSEYMVYFTQSGLSLPNRDYYLNEGEKFEKLRTALPDYMAQLFDLAGVEGGADRVAEVYAIEAAIAEAHIPAAEYRDVTSRYNPYSRDGLGDVSANMDWAGLLEGNRIPLSQDTVVLMNPGLATALGDMMQTHDLAAWQSYAAYKLLDAMAPYLSQDFVDARFEFTGKLVRGQQENEPRWQRGTGLINRSLGEAVGKVYVARYFPPEAKDRMDELVANLVDTFGVAIDGLEWMGAETKSRAQAKRLKFTTKIGYPDEWRDYSALIVRRDDLFGNVLRANEFEHMRSVNQLGGPIDRGEWGMTPQTVNAYHNPTMNEIVFPAAILQPPFFQLDAEDAVNYGAIGAVIGHEIGHAFDDNGRRFDGDGNLNDWWTEDDAKAFEAAAQRLVDQYNSFEGLPGEYVNGQLTLGENIGDLTGATIGWQAYLRSLDGAEPPVIDGLTGAERFLYGFAQIWQWKGREEALRARILSDPHAPPHWRVNGTLMNSQLFVDTFGVKEGDGMYRTPKDRVKIW